MPADDSPPPAARVENAWNRFWFDPADPLCLGAIRILTGAMLCYNLLVWSVDLESFFSDHGLQPREAIRTLYRGRFVFSFWLWLGDEYLWPVHCLCLIVAALFCLGYAGRITSMMAFVITISYSQRVPVANFGLDQILALLCFYLSLGPCSASLSLDYWIRQRKLRRASCAHADAAKTKTMESHDVPQRYASARMSLRLIQLHLCAIYFWAGMSKLKGGSWWTGEALWRVIANAEYQTIDLTWMAWVPWLPFLIAHLTVLWEIFFIVLVWNPRLRPWVLTIGTGMHFGIGAFLGMWTFGLIMAFAYLTFADPQVWRVRFARFGKGKMRECEF